MKPRSLLAAIGLVTVVASTLAADTDGWRPLFNGKDLSGWVPVQVAPNTFTVRDGIIVSTGVPTGVMRTDRQYENFELELEWKHIVPQGNAGLFVWSYPITAVGQPFTKSIEVQILDGRNSETHTSHGDIFSIHGARMKPDRPHPRGAERCLPSEFRCKPAGEWNHYRVVCNNGVVKLSVNGKEVSGGSECTPRKGYICLESEGTECHFRNIRLKELPSTNRKPEETAPLDEGFVSIYNGLNLEGWKTSPVIEKHWRVKDWILAYDGNRDVPEIWTTKTYRNFQMIIDWRITKKENVAAEIGVLVRSARAPERDVLAPTPFKIAPENTFLAPINFKGDPSGKWNRVVITARNNRVEAWVNDEETPHQTTYREGQISAGSIGLQPGENPIEFANIYIKELK